jgi:protein-disulfide isomerase
MLATAGLVAAAAVSIAAARPVRDVVPGPGTRADSTLEHADAGRIRGAASATVWLVEASDFQCPYCKQWHDETYPLILKEYVNTGKVRLAYLNFPLEMHQHAQVAAEAAMCASAQGKFWEMHDALFSSQAQWENLPNPMSVFEGLATKAGVNVAAWRTCVTSHATLPLIAADKDRLNRSGVGSTPTFFIGSQKIEGAYPIAVFRDALDKALAAAAKR